MQKKSERSPGVFSPARLKFLSEGLYYREEIAAPLLKHNNGNYAGGNYFHNSAIQTVPF